MKTSKLSIILWIVQVLLALLFVFSGGMKLVLSAATLTKGTPFSAGFLRFIGVAELLGGIGLVVPAATRIKPWLTPLAALGLVIIMIGAVVVTLKMSIPMAILPFVTGVLLVLVAWGRWRGAPIVERTAQTTV